MRSVGARQMRMNCRHCKAEWWFTPGSQINPMDHMRPDGRNCRRGNPLMFRASNDCEAHGHDGPRYCPDCLTEEENRDRP